MSAHNGIADQIMDEIDDFDFDGYEDDYIDCVFIPDGNSDEFPVSDGEVTCDDENDIEGGKYELLYNKYNESQKLLEENHTYKWVDGEVKYDYDLENKLFLTNLQKNKIKSMSKVEIFELFFSGEVKSLILEATGENGLEISNDKFDGFLGILMSMINNIRKSERDYWSLNDMLGFSRIRKCLHRDEFLKIKNHLKFSKASEINNRDRIGKVRGLLDIFRKNIQQFGFFSSNMSIDESMIKFFGRTVLKQYMPNKPIRFGIKLWSLCTISGYLLDFDIYCGKQTNIDAGKLQNCSLGSQVIMKMLHNFFKTVPSEELNAYHVAFDNYFTNPDVLVHLIKIGLKATGTVRQNRVYEIIETTNKKGNVVPKRQAVQINLNNKSERGKYEVKHDLNSNINYITVKDSKIVSILTTAVGVTPPAIVSRYNAKEKKRVDIYFPQGFKAYNKSMGGVDLHDQHCNDLRINVSSKKWTWAVFRRIIEASLSNAFVLWSLCVDDEIKKKDGVKEFSLEIADIYLARYTEEFKNHKFLPSHLRQICFECHERISKVCIECSRHYCTQCFSKTHNVIVHEKNSSVKKGYCIHCAKRTPTFCENCDSHICPTCFPIFHKRKQLKFI